MREISRFPEVTFRTCSLYISIIEGFHAHEYLAVESVELPSLHEMLNYDLLIMPLISSNCTATLGWTHSQFTHTFYSTHTKYDLYSSSASN